MRRLPLLASSLASLLFSLAAHATPATYDISFNATGQLAASGSFTLTFDPSQSYELDTRTGLVVNFLSFGAGVSAFTYDRSPMNDVLTIGGRENTVGALTGYTNDYRLQINAYNYLEGGGFTPALLSLAVSQGGYSGIYFDTFPTAGTVTITKESAPPTALTPEPSSFLLLATGLLGIGNAVRRRFLPV